MGGSSNLYFIEAGNFRVRRLNLQTALISTAAGNGLQASGPPAENVPATQVAFVLVLGIAVHPNGDLVIAEYGAHRIMQVSQATGLINTVAGNGTALYCGETSAPLDACLFEPQGVAVDTNNDVYIADTGNRRIRKLSAETGLLSTYAGRSGPENQYLGDGGPAIDVNFPWGVKSLAFDAAGNLYGAGGSGNRVYRIDKITGLISVIAGTGEWGFSGDGGPALAAKTQGIDSVVVDGEGNVYFADSFNYRVRKVAAGTGIITTVAGNGLTTGPLGDGGPATAASLDGPRSLKFDQNGNLLVMDYQHRRIRKIDKSTGIITTIAGNGWAGYDGDGRLATAASINDWSFTTDASGNIFLVGSTLRWIEASTGIIRTIPGATQPTAEGFFIDPWELAADNSGHLYDATGQVILKISGLPVALPDNTPPQIQPNVTGTLGSDGWYTSNVQVTWTVTDPETAVTKTGCDATTVTQDTANVVFTCTATSGGGSNSASVTLKRDATPPTVTVGALSPAADSRGWNNSEVSIPYTLSDDLSGLVPVTLPNPLTYTNEGVHVTMTTTVSDVAGNTTALEFPVVKIDKTPPTVSPDVSGTPGANGWYRGNVQIAWSINEIPESIESTNGCDTIAVENDTPGAIYTCTVTSAGGSASSSTTVKVDSTAPTLVFGAAAPAANGNGWHNATVVVPFSTNDATSGVESTSVPSPLTFANEGVGLHQTVTVTDAAGNSASFASVPLNIDKTAPLVAPVVTGPLGLHGWYVGDTQLDWSINEFPASIVSSSGCESHSLLSDTAGVTYACSVTSGGGTAGGAITLKRDATPPVLVFGAYSPAPNANGWNKTNVTVPFTRSDALSGIGTTSASSPLTFNVEGAGLTKQVIVSDLAGNSATFTTAPRNIDKTAPYAEMESPIDAATYGFYADVVADFVCEDLSLASCTAPVANGAMVNTTSAGAHSFKVTAKDLAGFTTNHTHNYSVASSFNFNGFLAPIRAAPTLNQVPRGSLVPVRWRLPDGRGGFVSNPASFVSATVATFTCSGSVVQLVDNATGPAGLSFDAATGTFTYNWATDGSWTGCRKLTIKLKDNSTRELRFKFQ